MKLARLSSVSSAKWYFSRRCFSRIHITVTCRLISGLTLGSFFLSAKIIRTVASVSGSWFDTVLLCKGYPFIFPLPFFPSVLEMRDAALWRCLSFTYLVPTRPCFDAAISSRSQEYLVMLFAVINVVGQFSRSILYEKIAVVLVLFIDENGFNRFLFFLATTTFVAIVFQRRSMLRRVLQNRLPCDSATAATLLGYTTIHVVYSITLLCNIMYDLKFVKKYMLGVFTA